MKDTSFKEEGIMIAFEFKSGCHFSQKTTLLTEKKFGFGFFFSISPLSFVVREELFFTNREIRTKRVYH